MSYEFCTCIIKYHISGLNYLGQRESNFKLILGYNEMQCLSMYEVCVSPVSISKLFIEELQS